LSQSAGSNFGQHSWFWSVIGLVYLLDPLHNNFSTAIPIFW